MSGVLRAIGALVIAAAGAPLANLSDARAQSNSALASAAPMPSLSAADLESMLSELSIKTERRAGQAGSAPTLVATTPGGAKFLVGLFQCSDPNAARGCTQVLFSTAQSSSGIEYADLNAFNGQASVTTAFYEPNSQIIIFGRNFFTLGGVMRDNVKTTIVLFLRDMQGFVTSRASISATIAFGATPQPRSKLDSVASRLSNPAAPRAPGFVSSDSSLEIEIAISNTNDKVFSAEEWR